MHGIGDHSAAAPHDAGRQFPGREHQIDDEPDECHPINLAFASFCVVCLHKYVSVYTPNVMQDRQGPASNGSLGYAALQDPDYVQNLRNPWPCGADNRSAVPKNPSRIALRVVRDGIYGCGTRPRTNQ